MSKAGIRVVVVDEHLEVLRALAASLECVAGVEQVRAAVRPDEALKLAREWQPHVVLLEVKRRDGRGLELCRTLSAIRPQPAVLVFTSYANPVEELEAMGAGAAGYLLKETDNAALVSAVLRLGNRNPRTGAGGSESED